MADWAFSISAAGDLGDVGSPAPMFKGANYNLVAPSSRVSNKVKQRFSGLSKLGILHILELADARMVVGNSQERLSLMVVGK